MELISQLFMWSVVYVPGACDFDMPSGLWQETCQLSQDPHDDFDWDIGYGRMRNGTGPSADHSHG